jgi:hypothetical protein
MLELVNLNKEAEMISAWELYLWTRLDIVQNVSNFLLAACIIGSIVACIVYVASLTTISVWCDDTEMDRRKRKEAHSSQQAVIKSLKYLAITCFVTFVFALVPSKKDAAMIWIVPQLATVENAELLKGEAAEIYKFAKQALTESLDVTQTD